LLRLPPHMYDLTPAELAWAKIKRTVHENITGDLSL
jgi:transposase